VSRSDPLDLAYETSTAGSEGGPGPGGPPLLLLHAFPLDRTMWRDVAGALSGLVPTVLVDLPGSGGSPLPTAESRPSLDVAADGVAGVLDRLGVERAIVAGSSMGGYAAMAFARRHSGRLAGVALVDTKAAADTWAAAVNRERIAAAVTGPAGTRALLPMLEGLLGATSRARRPELVAVVRERMLAASPPGVAWCQRAMAARPDSAGTLAELRVPAAVVVGEEDTLTGLQEARSMALMLRDCVLTVVPQAGHLAPVERPIEVARALISLTLRVGP